MNTTQSDVLKEISLSDKEIDLEFAKDIILGLTSKPKFLSSKYFYNEKGDQLFQRIMEMDEYYPTNCEFEIFNAYKNDLLFQFDGRGDFFDLVEFGAGDGLKTKILIDHFIASNAAFKYIPIDISANILEKLNADLERNFPALDVETFCGDYFTSLQQLRKTDERKKVVLFLGSNIGNFTHTGTLDFLTQLNKNLSKGDQLLIGFDLKKDPEIILKAYNDDKGITKAFNLNLLERINEEFDADFDIDSYNHWPVYNPETGEARSYIISKKNQTVNIDLLDITIPFMAWETIHTEISRKYDLPFIAELAEKTGFKIVKNFQDAKRYYVDSLWEVK